MNIIAQTSVQETPRKAKVTPTCHVGVTRRSDWLADHLATTILRLVAKLRPAAVANVVLYGVADDR